MNRSIARSGRPLCCLPAIKEATQKPTLGEKITQPVHRVCSRCCPFCFQGKLALPLGNVSQQTDSPLYFDLNGIERPLPAWGKFWFDLGRQVGAWRHDKQRLIVGVAAPTRAYAASFTASGIVASRADSPDNFTAAQHFKYLTEQPLNTPVRLRERDRILNGFLLGIQRLEGEVRIGVCVSNRSGGSLTHWIRESDALRISLHTGELTKLAKNPTGRQISRGGFIRAFVPLERLVEFQTRTVSECVIISQINLLRKEVEETTFVAKVGKLNTSGTLQELLRVSKFQTADAPYRTQVLRQTAGRPDTLPLKETPRVIIFDGSEAFLKWHDYWRGANWVVLLDQSEVRLRDAAGVLYGDFVQRRVGEVPLRLTTAPPQGVEMMIFQERRQ